MTTREELSENLQRATTWRRLFFMIIFTFMYGVAHGVIGATVVLQIGWSLITSERNQELQRFGGQLADYVHDIVDFLTYNSERKPFPFDSWGAKSGD